MGKITLHSDNSTSATSVSNIFIDEYMTDANGEFVKIYLYLLRLMNAPDAAFSISSIADRFEHTEKDIKRALNYWERMNLLRLEYDDNENLTGICLLDSSQAPAPDKTADDAAALTPETVTLTADDAAGTKEKTTADEKNTTPAKKSYSPDDIRAFRENESVAELFFITERYLGRTLTATDVDTVLYFYDVLGFSTDLIEYLVEYCVCKGHTSIRYIEKVALGWSSSGITTVEQAKQAVNTHGQTYFAVMKALGISGRNLVPTETAFIEKWKDTYGFTTELIAEACQRTITATHQPSFEYTDSILTNWLKCGVKNKADIAKLDAQFQSRRKSAAAVPQTAAAANTSRNKFNNFDQRSYDYSEVERMLLTTGSR
jgi:DnaD/phage-associated family protein